jgi:hypothetical protein
MQPDPLPYPDRELVDQLLTLEDCGTIEITIDASGVERFNLTRAARTYLDNLKHRQAEGRETLTRVRSSVPNSRCHPTHPARREPRTRGAHA